MSTAELRDVRIAGPFYEDLVAGQVLSDAPALTLTEGHAALHQAIVGDRLRLALDRELSARVTGEPAPLAHPALVCDVAIGQSTLVTQRVIANLFYRGLVLRRAPHIGDTLRTTTEIVALRDTASRPAGLAALRVRTVDQEDRAVLDFHRCAMLPMRDEAARPGHADDLDAISDELPDLTGAIAGWDLSVFPAGGRGLTAGTRFVIEGGDTVTSAPELARLSLNVAAAHTDPAASGRGQRLVYGGHTIGIALAQATRALPDLVTVLGWRSCSHLGPVFEGDVLHTALTVEAVEPAASGVLIDLRAQTSAVRGDAVEPVLDWRFVGVMA